MHCLEPIYAKFESNGPPSAQVFETIAAKGSAARHTWSALLCASIKKRLQGMHHVSTHSGNTSKYLPCVCATCVSESGVDTRRCILTI